MRPTSKPSNFEYPTGPNKILTGAQITFVNSKLVYGGSNTDNHQDL